MPIKTSFYSLKLEDKLQVKQLGTHQPNDFSFTQADRMKWITFCNLWFTIKSWLTVSDEKQRLFCFFCLLFGGEGLWQSLLQLQAGAWIDMATLIGGGRLYK